jgi:diguanylate cyclase (GGDEF)-like protein/PAS domain S-box-containing protein
MLEPVLDADGRLAAVLGATLPLDGAGGLGSIAARVNAGAETVMIDRTRMTVVGHADPGRLLEPASSAGALGAVLDRVGPMLRGDDPRGAGRFGAEVVGWAAVPDTDWVLFEVADGDRVAAALVRTRRVAAIASLAFAAACTVAMFAGLMWMFRPITQLRDRALRVLTEPADVDRDWPVGRDEIGELSRVFRHILRERATAEQGSLRTIGQLQAILDNASVGIAFTRHQRFELISRSMAELTGYSRAALFGRPMRMLSTDDATHDALNLRIAAALAAEGRFEVETPLRRADGTVIWVRAVGSPLDRAAATSGTIWIVEDITEARRLREQLSWSATRDPLTELLNRRELEARLAAHLARPQRPDGALLLLDLDRFKAVNDTGGHAAGDRLLCDLARAIEAQVRQVDSVARLGGDEFAVLLVGCPVGHAVEIAERIRHGVGAYRLTWQGRTHSVGVSVGVVAIDGAFGTVAQVLQAADAACYAAKRTGRDAVRVWGGVTDRSVG